MLLRRTPLAWRNLVHDKRRLAVSVAGITFAVVLMFMQVGFRNALIDGTVELLRKLNADIFIKSRVRYMLSVTEPFARRRLYQASTVDGVSSGATSLPSRAAVLRRAQRPMKPARSSEFMTPPGRRRIS